MDASQGLLKDKLDLSSHISVWDNFMVCVWEGGGGGWNWLPHLLYLASRITGEKWGETLLVTNEVRLINTLMRLIYAIVRYVEAFVNNCIKLPVWGNGFRFGFCNLPCGLAHMNSFSWQWRWVFNIHRACTNSVQMYDQLTSQLTVCVLCHFCVVNITYFHIIALIYQFEMLLYKSGIIIKNRNN